jgi:hypothetical protein
MLNLENKNLQYRDGWAPTANQYNNRGVFNRNVRQPIYLMQQCDVVVE